MKIPPPLQQVNRTYVRHGRRQLSYFAGCDYFRLASHPAVLRAAEAGLKSAGLNVSASRLTTGNHVLFGQLEAALEKFFAVESATLVTTGYVTNLIVAQALAGEFTAAFLDAKAHPALVDAAVLLGVPVTTFAHRDPADLKAVLKKNRPSGKILLLTDGMFSHDGSIAPLAEYVKILPKNAWLLVDDAHGAGTLGEKGRGTVELAGLDRERVIQTVTLSKAFGCYGGAILGSAALREKILQKGRLFLGSTPLPLPLAAAALKSVATLGKNPAWRTRLHRNATHVKTALRAAGYPVADNPGPIFAIVPKSSAHAEALKARCLKAGVFPSFIKYHGGPENGYFRFVISSEHTPAQLEALLNALIGGRT